MDLYTALGENLAAMTDERQETCRGCGRVWYAIHYKNGWCYRCQQSGRAAYGGRTMGADLKRLLFLVVVVVLGFILFLHWVDPASAAPASHPIPSVAQRATDDAPASEGVIITTIAWRVRSVTTSSYYDSELRCPTGKIYRIGSEVEIVVPDDAVTNPSGVKVLKGLEDRPDAIYYVYFRMEDLNRVLEKEGGPPWSRK